jgi:hypothetical protein
MSDETRSCARQAIRRQLGARRAIQERMLGVTG